MSPWTRRRTIGAIVAVLAVLLVFGAWRAFRFLAIGVAYKAKTLCSGTFVSGRDPGAVVAELQTDDLAILRLIGFSVDGAARSVTASGLGIVRRRALYREGLGCALALDGLIPPGLPAGAKAVLTQGIPPTDLSEPSRDERARRELDVVVTPAF